MALKPTLWMHTLTLVATVLVGGPAWAQPAGEAAEVHAAQTAAMRALGAMTGVWRGSAWTLLPSGEKVVLTQTERIGPLLDGAVKVVEGRGYDSGGRLVFNALGIISFDHRTQQYSLRAYNQGRVGDFALKQTDHGYSWEIPAGPATIRYTATLSGETLREVGERHAPGSPPLQVFEMVLTRVGPTDWPAAGAPGPK